jgi:hypothetical protein
MIRKGTMTKEQRQLYSKIMTIRSTRAYIYSLIDRLKADIHDLDSDEAETKQELKKEGMEVGV